MALTGLGQGASVSLALGSAGVLSYVIAGGLLWNFLMRPLEEADLEARFGEAFRAYRRNVPCWYPRWDPYSSE
jgi:protein-S-isoprenylcysteine O-methyltransferase Ste14